MATMKFFHQLARPIQTFIGMKAPRRSGDNQEIVITFRITLNGQNIRSAPAFIKSAYEEIQNGADYVGLKKEIENMNVELYNLPDSKRANFRLPRLHLERLAVKETKNSEGDTSTMLTFETTYPWDAHIWAYLGDHYSTDVFTRFDSAQASLLDLEEAAGEAEPGPDEEEEEDEGKKGPDEEEEEEQPDTETAEASEEEGVEP